MFPVRWSVVWLWISCVRTFAQATSEEVELFNSIKQASLKWTSDAPKEWTEKLLAMGSETAVPVYQACTNNDKSRSLLTAWIARTDALHLLMDLKFAQEDESSSNQLSPLQIHLLESDFPLPTFQKSHVVRDIRALKAFTVKTAGDQIKEYLEYSSGLMLNTKPLSRNGFQLGFTYSGPCVFIASVRLYYRRCPGFLSHLAGFGGAPAGAGPVTGSCVKGALVPDGPTDPPKRECHADGTWGPLRGGCTCARGYEEKGDSCEACRAGYYKAARSSGGCVPCPANSKTAGEGADECDCVPGFFRIQGDPYVIGCTKPPSAPVNVSVRHISDSILTLLWEPPIDLGGRMEVTYDVECWERGGDSHGPWAECGEAVIFLPDSAGLTVSAINLTGVSSQLDYRLLVQARNNVSFQQGATASSVASINIHRWKSRMLNTAVPHTMAPEPSSLKRLFLWWIIGVLLGGLLLIALVVGFSVRCKYTKLGHDEEVVMLPIDTGVSYGPDAQPRSPCVELHNMRSQPDAVQLLSVVSDRLLTSLSQVLVDRNRLTLGKELGAGEFGSVYEGSFDPANPGGVFIKVAVKMMRVGINSQEDLESFLREAEIMQHFDHANVVRLLGVTLEQDAPLPVPLVILPFMQHGDLRRFLIATRYGDIPMFVPLQSLLRFMIDIAAGMEYLTSHGFLHRDLAARNCMLGDDLCVCVADFGLSKNIFSNDYYRQTVATRMPIKWMAMESLSESIFTIKTDVWSFGVTMWEIVSRGKTPYPGVHNYELLDLLSAGHRLKLPEGEDKLYEVMLSCWHDEPGRRPGFLELGERLRALLREMPPLDVSLEAHYINQRLEDAAHSLRGADGPGDEPGSEGAVAGNVYLPAPVACGKPAWKEEELLEDEHGDLCYDSGSPLTKLD